MLLQPESTLIIERLKEDLPPNLFYHSIDHTLDVYRMSAYYAEWEKVSPTDLKLLLIAALYHDAGYLYRMAGHETESCVIVNEILPKFGYSSTQLEQICQIIMATKLPQEPKSLLEQIICDADLDYLGRDDFFEIGDRLYKEMIIAGLIQDKKEWNNLQVDFLQKHHYFTDTARALRNVKKKENLNMLLLNNSNQQ